MGLLGNSEATFLSNRIFNLIRIEGRDYAEFEQFLGYLSVLMRGGVREKAELSFRFLDE
jgi:Ca2+-binding EF-hand superfamily protein